MNTTTSKGFVFLDKDTIRYVYLAKVGSWGDRREIKYTDSLVEADIFFASLHNVAQSIRDELAKPNMVKLPVSITRTVEIEE